VKKEVSVTFDIEVVASKCIPPGMVVMTQVGDELRRVALQYNADAFQAMVVPTDDGIRYYYKTKKESRMSYAVRWTSKDGSRVVYLGFARASGGIWADTLPQARMFESVDAVLRAVKATNTERGAFCGSNSHGDYSIGRVREIPGPDTFIARVSRPSRVLGTDAVYQGFVRQASDKAFTDVVDSRRGATRFGSRSAAWDAVKLVDPEVGTSVELEAVPYGTTYVFEPLA